MATTPKPTPELADELLSHCLVTFGFGAGGMRVKRDALIHLREIFRPKFELALGNGGEPRWNREGPFILECSAAIGRLAAQLAIGRGSIKVEIADAEQARSDVVAANGTLAGEWCQ